jgi:hypothetical protein
MAATPTQREYDECPTWLLRLWREMAIKQYTGPVTLQFQNGRVCRIDHVTMRHPKDLSEST